MKVTEVTIAIPDDLTEAIELYDILSEAENVLSIEPVHCRWIIKVKGLKTYPI